MCNKYCCWLIGDIIGLICIFIFTLTFIASLIISGLKYGPRHPDCHRYPQACVDYCNRELNYPGCKENCFDANVGQCMDNNCACNFCLNDRSCQKDSSSCKGEYISGDCLEQDIPDLLIIILWIISVVACLPGTIFIILIRKSPNDVSTNKGNWNGFKCKTYEST